MPSRRTLIWQPPTCGQGQGLWIDEDGTLFAKVGDIVYRFNPDWSYRAEKAGDDPSLPSENHL